MPNDFYFLLAFAFYECLYAFLILIFYEFYKKITEMDKYYFIKNTQFNSSHTHLVMEVYMMLDPLCNAYITKTMLILYCAIQTINQTKSCDEQPFYKLDKDHFHLFLFYASKIDRPMVKIFRYTQLFHKDLHKQYLIIKKGIESSNVLLDGHNSTIQ